MNLSRGKLRVPSFLPSTPLFPNQRWNRTALSTLCQKIDVRVVLALLLTYSIQWIRKNSWKFASGTVFFFPSCWWEFSAPVALFKSLVKTANEPFICQEEPQAICDGLDHGYLTNEGKTSSLSLRFHKKVLELEKNTQKSWNVKKTFPKE